MFYNGLSSLTKTILNTSAGGNFMAKPVESARALLEKMASTSYQWPSKRASVKPVTGMYELDEISSFKAQMASLTNALNKLTSFRGCQVNHYASWESFKKRKSKKWNKFNMWETKHLIRTRACQTSITQVCKITKKICMLILRIYCNLPRFCDILSTTREKEQLRRLGIHICEGAKDIEQQPLDDSKHPCYLCKQSWPHTKKHRSTNWIDRECGW